MNTFYYISTSIFALVILVTAVARLNDMGKENHNWNWWARRVGMILVALSCLLIIASPFSEYQVGFINFSLMLGIMLAWITTPQQPPWWRYITKGDQSTYAGARRSSDHAQNK